jgi:hypothetical protein
MTHFGAANVKHLFWRLIHPHIHMSVHEDKINLREAKKIWIVPTRWFLLQMWCLLPTKYKNDKHVKHLWKPKVKISWKWMSRNIYRRENIKSSMEHTAHSQGHRSCKSSN